MGKEESGGGGGDGARERTLEEFVNRQNAMGMTPLLLAAGRKPDSWGARVSHTLIKHGADPSIQDLTGRPPLSVALSADNPVTAQVLIHEGGADAQAAIDTVRWSLGGSPMWVSDALGARTYPLPQQSLRDVASSDNTSFYGRTFGGIIL